ncbi:PKD domain-containing protein [Tritonibacter scottomollicae]|uniref:HYR domain-containing protein n=1 Tax=Tritonibacter scottomollicae TaxID=483013 RepID=A0A2T1ANK0_TRISK|nr:Ig-like domain-containing protein [Tritonibacter scottomollicae]PRZ50181.1 HYR domain-containing protein [Tritonibacter scottomollicae]
MTFSFGYLIATFLGLGRGNGQTCQRARLISRLTRNCLPTLIGVMLWFTAAVPAQAQYNDCPPLNNIPPNGGEVWLDLTLDQCTHAEPAATSDVIQIQFDAINGDFNVGYYEAVPANATSFGAVVFEGITLTEGVQINNISCSGAGTTPDCDLSGTFDGSPISATASDSDGSVGSTPPANAAPTANAGADQSEVSGTAVTLDGSGSSDSDGTIASYAWSRTGGTGTAGNAVLSDATAVNPSFTDASLTSNDGAVTHIFALVVTDDDGATSVADSVTVTITPPANAAPTANAGADQSEVSGTAVTLDGSGSSDSDGTIASYAWSRTGGTGTAGNAVLSDATAVNPSFTDASLTSNDAAVTHIFALVVTDDDGATSVADSVTVTITPPANAAPTANAGADQSEVSGTAVTLDGSGSSDSDGTIASYAWSRTGGTGTAGNAVLSDATAVNPSFTDASLTSNDAAVTHIFALVVTDDDGATSVADSVTVTITPPLDTEPPVIDEIADVAVDTDSGVNTASVALVANVADNSGEVIAADFSIDGTVIASPYDFSVGTTQVTATAQDSAGNAATPQTFEVTVTDTTPPEAPVVAAPTTRSDGRAEVAGTAEPLSTVTVTFPDASVETAAAGPGGTFEVVSATAQSSGEIKIVAEDSAANRSETTTIAYVGDDTRPTLTISALTGPSNGTFSAAITLSEASTNFDASDLTLTNASATMTGSGTQYSVVLTPDADGTVAVSVGTNRFSDAAGNGNEASNTSSVEYDGTAPTVSITGAPEVLAGASLINVNVTFSESVTGFAAGDITTTNANVVGLSGSGSDYVATLRAFGTGAVGITVPANVAVDAAGNGNLESNAVTIEDQTVEQTQRLIASFMQSRANQLISNQPDLVPFLSGSKQASFGLMATRGVGNFNVATGTKYPVWAQVKGAWSSSGDSDSTYVFGAFGVHRAISKNVLLGATLQFDHIAQDTGASTVSGTGWMLGPYFVAKSSNHPLYFEGRLLYGETTNDISPFGTYEDRFYTTRMLANLKVAGDLSMGTTILSPFLDASYSTEDQHSYVDTLGNTIPGQDFKLGQVEVGLDFSQMLSVNTGELELWGGVSGIWSYSNGTGSVTTADPAYEGGRARVELGFNRQITAGQSVTGAAFYDGIGAAGFESYGLSLGYQLQF